MLEYALTNYLTSDTTLVSYFYSNKSIYITQAPTKAVMPWLILLNIGGSRDQISKTRVEENSTVRIAVDFPATEVDMKKGRLAIERAKYLLEHYRGDMGSSTIDSHNAYDVYIICSAVEDVGGISGTYRYQFTARIRSIEGVISPVHTT